MLPPWLPTGCAQPRARGVRLRLLGVALVLASLAPAAAVVAADDQPDKQKRVLVLYSTRRDTQIAILGDREMPGLLERGLGAKVDYYSEHLDSARFPEEQYRTAIRDYLQLKYQGQRFDLVVAVRGGAVELVGAYRQELFGATPLVFTTEDLGASRPPNSVGLGIDRDFGRTLTLVRSLQPEVTEVFVVSGSSRQDAEMERAARAQFDRFASSFRFTYLSGLPTDELEKTVASLPERAVLYYLLFYRDAAGTNMNPLEYLHRLATVANRPTYSWVDSTIDRGVVGGSLVRHGAEIEAVSGLAVRVLRGEAPDSIPLTTPNLNAYQVDWRQLRRWGISEARIPPGTIVEFREPGAWDRYGEYIAAGLLLVLLQAALIAGLVVQNRRRRRAEAELRRRETELRASYDRIRDLGGRLLAAQDAERSRIARELHDDISQQVAVLAIDLELLNGVGPERHGDADRLRKETLERAHGIARTVRDISHRLHPTKLGLIGLVAALDSLRRELTQPTTAVTFTHENVPPSLPPNLTLSLYRVAQEAIHNAISHGAAVSVAVHLTATADAITLTIEDDGVGFDVAAGTGHGLGLLSMSERLEPLGGALKIRSAPGTGTWVQASVPLPAAGAPAVAGAAASLSLPA